MMEARIVDEQNQEAGSLTLPEEIFGRERRPDILARMVGYQLAKRRAGTADTKRRGEVRGGGRKPFRQKGTGHARQGTIRAPHYRTGGVVFGPHPRDFSVKLPKKVRRLALLTALSAKYADGDMVIVNALTMGEIKTKVMRQKLDGLGVTGTALVVLGGPDENVMLSARNLPGILVTRPEGVNVYDILRHEKLVVTQDALMKLQEKLA